MSGSKYSINCSTSNCRHPECIRSSPSIDTNDHSCTLRRHATRIESKQCEELKLKINKNPVRRSSMSALDSALFMSAVRSHFASCVVKSTKLRSSWQLQRTNHRCKNEWSDSLHDQLFRLYELLMQLLKTY